MNILEKYADEILDNVTGQVPGSDVVDRPKVIKILERFKNEANRETSIDVFAEMHKGDLKNNTEHLAISPYFIEGKLAKGGAHITMGVPAQILMDIAADLVMVFLVAANKSEYKRLKPRK